MTISFHLQGRKPAEDNPFNIPDREGENPPLIGTWILLGNGVCFEVIEIAEVKNGDGNHFNVYLKEIR